MLVNLAAADSQPMSVTKSHTGDALQRLPLDERQWLAKGGFELLVAIRRGNGSTVGLLALSAKRSGLD